MYRAFLLFIILFMPQPSYAWLGATAYTAAGVGQLSTQEPVIMTMAPLGARAYLSLKLTRFLRISLGGSFHHGRVSYLNSDIQYTGAYNAYGGSLGLTLALGSLLMQFRADALVNGSLSSKSEIQTEVNGVIYRHSTLVKYSSSVGGFARFGLIMENDDKQILNFMIMKVGLIFDLAVLPIDKETTNIATNQIGSGAAGEWVQSVNYNFTYGAVGLLIGLEF